MSDRELGNSQELIKIAIPAILENLFSVLVASIDTKMIAVLGSTAISAVSLTTQPKLVFYAVFFALGSCTSILISQSFGRKNAQEARKLLVTILRITIALSVVLGIVLFLAARPIMSLCSRQKESLDLSVEFFRILLGLVVFQAVSVVLNAALRGVGKTRATLVSNIVMGIVDIFFNYLLIEGHWGFPRLEVAGDAIATVAGTFAACIVSLVAVSKDKFLSINGLFSFNEHADAAYIKPILQKSGNIVIENIFQKIGFLISGMIVSSLSVSETSVYFVSMILLNYSFAFGEGIQTAVVALVGRSKGEGNYAKLKQTVKNGLCIGIVCSCILCITLFLFSRKYFSLYFTDEASIRSGMMSSAFVAVITFVQICRIIMLGAVRGIGEVKATRNIATICILLFNPAVSALMVLLFGLGINGIWISSVLTQILWFVLGDMAYRKYILPLGNVQNTDNAD